MLDFVLKKTNSSKLFFIGHSQGSAALMVLLSQRPEYNDKVISAHLMAPAVFLNNLPHPFIRFFASEFNAFVDKYRSYDIMSSSQIMKFIEPMYSFVCQRSSFAFNMCSNMMTFMCGQNENGTEIDLRILPDFLKHLAHAVSIKQVHHFIQLYQSGKFQMYDYLARNFDIYKRSSPPEYDLRKAVAGVYLYSGRNDDLVAEKVGFEILRVAVLSENCAGFLQKLRHF
jgi:pimeloyl-ACP methyl ester carboxylesterase